MSKQDSKSKKNYSNIKTIKLDPLGERLSDAGHTGGASKKLKFEKKFDTLLKKMDAKEVKWTSNVKIKPFKPVSYFKSAYKRILKKEKLKDKNK